jgi:hypothetical protein
MSDLDVRRLVQGLQRDADRRTLLALSALAKGQSSYGGSTTSLGDLVAVVSDAVSRGRLAFFAGWGAPGAAPAATDGDDLGASVRAVMGGETDLDFEGKRYRFVMTSAVRRTLERGYRLVEGAQAADVVGRMAAALAETPDDEESWSDVVAEIGAAPAVSRLRLLRYVPRGSSTPSDEPALTPSQLRPKPVEDWIEISIVYDDGTPFTDDCVVELPGGRSTNGPPGEGGVIRMDGIPPGDCKVQFPTLADAFDDA